MHIFLKLVTQFKYLYTKTIIMDIIISFGKWRGSQHRAFGLGSFSLTILVPKISNLILVLECIEISNKSSISHLIEVLWTK
jgi:hypothetical protein